MVLHPSEILDVVVGKGCPMLAVTAIPGMVGFRFSAPMPSENDSKQLEHDSTNFAQQHSSGA